MGNVRREFREQKQRKLSRLASERERERDVCKHGLQGRRREAASSSRGRQPLRRLLLPLAILDTFSQHLTLYLTSVASLAGGKAASGSRGGGGRAAAGEGRQETEGEVERRKVRKGHQTEQEVNFKCSQREGKRREERIESGERFH